MLPDIQYAGMGQEYDRDKTPDSVDSGVFIKRWDVLKAQGDRANLGLYVALVAFQIEPVTRNPGHDRFSTGHEPVQRIGQAWNRADIRDRQAHDLGPTFRQHPAHAFSLLLPPLARFGHLVPEVLGIKRQAVEQEAGDNFGTASGALVLPDTQLGLSTASRAGLERDGGIKREAARAATAPSLGFHGQGAVAPRAISVREYYLIEELPGPGHKLGNRLRQAQSPLNDLRAVH